MSDVRSILYLCDGKACEEPDHCMLNSTGECRHTTRWEHALHKDADPDGFRRTATPDGVILWEPDDED